jgi:hypothetical protein
MTDQEIDESIVRHRRAGEALYKGCMFVGGRLVLLVETKAGQRWTWAAEDCQVAS